MANPSQSWAIAPLCNGTLKVINMGTDNTMVSGPKDLWTSSGPLDVRFGEHAVATRRSSLGAIHQETQVEDIEEGSLPQGNHNTMEMVPMEYCSTFKDISKID